MPMENEERIITTIIDETAAGQRIDLYLSNRFTYHSRRKWQDVIKAGKILLNGKRTRCSRVLQAGEKVDFIPDVDEPSVEMKYSIVYEDEYFMAINKEGNLPCHPAGPFFKNTLWYDLSRTYEKIGIVNRLDRETSGLLLVGKIPEATKALCDLFIGSHDISKRYYALVFGAFDKEITAEGFLVSDTASEVRKKRRFVMKNDYSGDDGESAYTLLRPIKTGGEISLVEALPQTGRLHQIRATLYSLGYPMIGDKLYGPDDTAYIRFARGEMTESDYTMLRMRRQALHAHALEFTHPFTGQPMKLSAPIPDDMNEVIPV